MYIANVMVLADFGAGSRTRFVGVLGVLGDSEEGGRCTRRIHKACTGRSGTLDKIHGTDLACNKHGAMGMKGGAGSLLQRSRTTGERAADLVS